MRVTIEHPDAPVAVTVKADICLEMLAQRTITVDEQVDLCRALKDRIDTIITGLITQTDTNRPLYCNETFMLKGWEPTSRYLPPDQVREDAPEPFQTNELIGVRDSDDDKWALKMYTGYIPLTEYQYQTYVLGGGGGTTVWSQAKPYRDLTKSEVQYPNARDLQVIRSAYERLPD
jgi:hypothetical protein